MPTKNSSHTTNGAGCHDIKEEAAALREHVEAIAREVYQEGKGRAQHLRDEAVHAAGEVRDRTGAEIEKAENYVRANPGRSILMAFAGGVLASLLLRRH